MIKHEKIIKRPDGTQYKIDIYLMVDSFRGIVAYNEIVSYREKNKLKWADVPDTMAYYELRSLSLEDRALHASQNYLRFVTAEEILSAKLELWNKLKPE